MTAYVQKINGINPPSHSRYFEVDLDFEDEQEVVRNIGIETCVEAFDENDIYAELGGWDSAKEFYADAIADSIDEEVENRLEEQFEKRFTERLREMQALKL